MNSPLNPEPDPWLIKKKLYREPALFPFKVEKLPSVMLKKKKYIDCCWDVDLHTPANDVIKPQPAKDH